MSISGTLEDVGVSDVMQFIYIGQSTGTLYCERHDEKAEIRFHEGRIVAARGTGSARLGDLLFKHGVVTRATMDRALAIQAASEPRQVLGEVLVAMEVVTPDDLVDVVEAHIQETIIELLTWTRGTFRFALCDVHPIEGFERTPGEILPDVDLNTQAVLLEAARIFDSRNRDKGTEEGDHFIDQAAAISMPTESTRVEPVDAPPPAVSPTEVSSTAGTTDVLPDVVEGDAGEDDEEGFGDLDFDLSLPVSELVKSVHVVSSNRPYLAELKSSLEERGIRLDQRALDTAGFPTPGDGAPIVLFDLGPDLTLEMMSELHRREPSAAILALLDSATEADLAFESGAVAVSTHALDELLRTIEEVAESRSEAPPRISLAPPEEMALDKLRRLSEEIRSGVLSTSASLFLLKILSESLDRALLFLVKPDALTALGGFGTTSADRRPLAVVTRKLSLPLDDDNPLTDAVDDRRARAVDWTQGTLPDELTALIGPPSNNLGAIFPVLGADKVILVVYADNGRVDEPIRELEVIDLVAAQVGLAIENELLRQRLPEQEA